MASTRAISSAKQVEKVQLKVMVNKEMNKVMYAEAGKDFVDVLLSFLTLPLGTIARLVAKESSIEAVKVGSLSSLYQSVADLDEQCLWSLTCKEMLLNPRNSMDDYCRPVKLNIDDTEPLKYFRCPSWDCNRKDIGSLLSTFRNQKCTCGKVMNTDVSLECLNLENGFVSANASFIISDDLHVMPNDFGATLCLLQKLGVNNSNNIQEQTVDITKNEVIDLLKLSLLSKTSLTDFVFKKKQFLSSSSLRVQSELGIGKVESSVDGRQMDLKVMVRKSDGEIVFAEAKEDFADFLFSFLTFPLGGVLHMLEGFTSLGCLCNLYESMKELSPERHLISQDIKDKLTKPKIASQFDLTNQMLPIGAPSLPVYYSYTYQRTRNDLCVKLRKEKVPLYVNYSNTPDEKCVQFSFVDLKPSSSKSSCFGEYAKGPITFMVTDNLVVTPMSSASAMSYLNRSEIPLLDLEVKVIKIGIKECLAILKASLISATALTDGLSQLITIEDPTKNRKRTIKEEK